jgi:hypothetical protein
MLYTFLSILFSHICHKRCSKSVPNIAGSHPNQRSLILPEEVFMGSNRLAIFILPITALLSLAIACNLPGMTAASDQEVIATLTSQARATSIAATVQAQEREESGPETDTTIQTTPTPTSTETPPSVESTPTATVVHITQPSDPGSLSSYVTDRSTKSLASERRAIADNFDWNLFERPFTSQVMDYRDYLDITRGELSLSSPWVYVTIFLEGSPPDGAQATYGIELDLTLDGRGDWLIVGLVPSDSTWTTDGVRAFKDANNDVGGATPIQADVPSPSLDGYEELVFDQGYGPDPDAAWIRRDPSHADRIQLAFKHGLIGSDVEFLWGAWADEGVSAPEWLDYNDHFTIAEAGSPASESSNYPIKALAEVDNTCRWAYGFTPDGSEPGVCPVPQTPTPTPVPGRINGYVFFDHNGNGRIDGSEQYMLGVEITLGAGGCPASGYSTETTDVSGFSFVGLPPGRYCVSVEEGTLPPAYAWSATTDTQYPVEVLPGVSGMVAFGFR